MIVNISRVKKWASKVIIDPCALPPKKKRDRQSKIENHKSTILKLWGTGKSRREFLYVDDLADAVVFLMRNYHAKDIGEFVNIGTGKDLTIKGVG